VTYKHCAYIDIEPFRPDIVNTHAHNVYF